MIKESLGRLILFQKMRVWPFLSKLEFGSSDLDEISGDFQRHRLGNDSTLDFGYIPLIYH